MTASGSRAAIAWTPLLGLAAAKILIHFSWASEYGFHRDELYYIMCGRHLAWGFVDHPPITALVARMVEVLFGTNLVALRMVPAVVGAALVVLAGLMAREMGGRAWAQGLAGAAVLATPAFLMTHHLFQTIAFDQLAWVGGSLLAMLVLRTGRPSLWVVVGGVAGLGLLAKYTVALFGLGLVAGLLLTPNRRHLLSPWLWVGGGLAALILLPNLHWQLGHGWPSLEFVRNNNARVAEEFSSVALIGIQAAFLGVALLPLFAAGVSFLFGSRGLNFRLFGWMWLLVTGFLVAVGGKPYYSAPTWPLVLAAGAVFVEGKALERGWRLLRRVIPVMVLAGSLPMLWIVLPILPRETFARHHDKLPHKEFHEQFGWDDLAKQVAAVYDTLPDEERQRAGLMTESYGEAAALDILGPRYGLPRVTSPHNSYYFWGAPETEIVIAVAWSRRRLDRVFAEVQEVTMVRNSLGIPNQSSSQAIYICRRPLKPWREIWEELRFFV